MREVIENALAAQDDAAGGEIGALHHLDDLGELGVRILHQRDAGFDDFAQIVRRNLGRHADRDAYAAVDQQVGNARRQDFGLEFAFVVVGLEVDGFLVDVFEQRRGDAREARFGVPHGRGRIAIDGTEVSLPVDQRVAHREILRHADQGVVDRGVAVRVVFTHDVADDPGALARGAIGCRPISLIHKGCGGGPASGRRAHREGRGRRSRSWRNRGTSCFISSSMLMGILLRYCRRPLPRGGEFAGAQAGPAGDFPGQPCFFS